MKKISLSVLICCVSFAARSQELTWQQRFTAIKTVDSIVKIYAENLTFRDLTTDSISSVALRKWKSVFAPGANVFDDLNPDFFDDRHNKSFNFRERTVDSFIEKTTTVYPFGFTEATITNMNVGYDDLANSKVAYIAIEKLVRGKTKNPEGWKIFIKDTLLLTIKLGADFRSGNIEHISNSGAALNKVSYQILNDEDHDFVNDAKDDCPRFKGYIKYDGCDPPEGSFAFLHFFGGIGLTSTTLGKFADNINSNYQLEFGSITDKSQKAGATLGAEVEFFVGRNRHFGIGLGLSGTFIPAQLTIDTFNAIYQSDIYHEGSSEYLDPTGTNFVKIVSSNAEVSEIDRFYYLTVPVLAKYKTRLSKTGKWNIQLNAGVAVSIPLRVSVNPQSPQFNYEARYNLIDNSTFGYSSNDTSSTDILFTQKFVDSYGGSSTEFFQTLNQYGYDVALNKSYSDAPNYKNINTAATFIFKPTFLYRIRKDFYTDIGIQFMYDLKPHSNTSNEPFLLVDRVVDNYSSILSGSRNVRHFFIGATIGFSFALVKNYVDKDLY